MNITINERITHTLARAEARLLENKSAIKTYKNKARAQHVADTLSDNLASYWDVAVAPVYVVTLSDGRLIVCADLYQITKDSNQGGYVLEFLTGHWTLSTPLMIKNTIGQVA